MEKIFDFEKDIYLGDCSKKLNFEDELFDNLEIELENFNLDDYEKYDKTNCYNFLNFVINDRFLIDDSRNTDGFFIYLIGWMFQYGKIKKKNYDEAMKFYNIAIEKGNSKALINMAWNYQNGFCGVDQDYEKAIEYYNKAIEKGNTFAMTFMAWHYQNGFCGVDQDYEKAIEYYNNAIEKSNNRAV